VSTPVVAVFRFTLGKGQSIGPRELQSLWVAAAQLPDVSVGRVSGEKSDDRATYSLFAPHGLERVEEIETRLRRLFDDLSLRVSLMCVQTGVR